MEPRRGGEKLFACIVLFSLALNSCAGSVSVETSSPNYGHPTATLAVTLTPTQLVQDHPLPVSSPDELLTATIESQSQATAVESEQIENELSSPATTTAPETITATIPVNCKTSTFPGFLSCIDDARRLTIDIPDSWQEVKSAQWVYQDEVIGVTFSASPHLEAFENDKTMPGLFYASAENFTQWGGYLQFLEVYTFLYQQECDFLSRSDYNDGVFRGKLDHYAGCGGSGSPNVYVLAAIPLDTSFSALVIVIIQWPAEGNTELDHIWNSFYIGDF